MTQAVFPVMEPLLHIQSLRMIQLPHLAASLLAVCPALPVHRRYVSAAFWTIWWFGLVVGDVDPS